MLAEISYLEFLDWITYAELEPFDETRQDARTAHIVTTLNNIYRDSKKRPDPYPVERFMIPFGDAPKHAAPQQDWRVMKANAMLWSAAINSKAGK